MSNIIHVDLGHGRCFSFNSTYEGLTQEIVQADYDKRSEDDKAKVWEQIVEALKPIEVSLSGESKALKCPRNDSEGISGRLGGSKRP